MVLLTVLTVSTARSQDTTQNKQVCFPFWMARRIALDLEEKQRLEATARVTTRQLEALAALQTGTEKTARQKDLQLALLQKQVLLLEKRPKKRPDPPNNSLLWALRLTAALVCGYLLGSL